MHRPEREVLNLCHSVAEAVPSHTEEQPQKPTDSPPGGDLGGDGPGTYIKQVTDGTHIGCQGEERGVPSGQRGGTSYASAPLISSP